jgi:SsrA-binding protein
MNLVTKNKKATYEYEIIQKITAGIQLVGSEVKSIRNHKVSISESYCYIKGGEMYIRGMHISEYKQSGNYDNHDPIRERKLLLKKIEINKLKDGIEQSGLTIIPIAVIIDDRGLIKIEIALSKGKKMHDKRNDIKKRDIERDLNLKF